MVVDWQQAVLTFTEEQKVFWQDVIKVYIHLDNMSIFSCTFEQTGEAINNGPEQKVYESVE